MPTVNFGTGQTYPVLQDAINAAGAGGTVICHAGEYHQQATVHKDNVTIVANGTDTVVLDGWVDTGRPNTGGERPTNVLPTGDWVHWTSTGGTLPPMSFKQGAQTLIRVLGDSVVIDGIDFKNAAGKFVNLEGNNPEVKNCNFDSTRGSALLCYKISNIVLENLTFTNCVNFYLGGNRSHGVNHPGVISFTGCTNVEMRNIRTWNNGGETFLFDTWKFGSTTARIYDSYFSDGKEVLIYIHGAADIEFHRCAMYGTKDNESWGGKGFRGSDVIALEAQSNRSGPARCGSENVKFHNCLFVNTRSYLLAFTGDIIPANAGCSSTFTRNVEIRGCTFVQNLPSEILFQSTHPTFSNITFEGNVFWMAPGASGGRTGANWSGMSFNHNIWNKDPGHAKLRTGALIQDPLLENPSVLLSRNSIDFENYKLKSGSPARDAWSNQDLTEDFFGSVRGGTTGDMGFHDYDASGAPAPEEPNAPTVGFDMKSGGVDVTSVEPGDLVELTDTSSPGSGETITGYEWNATIIGSAIEFPATTQNHSFTPTVAGTYAVGHEVHQSDGQNAFISRSLVVKENVEVEPPPPPPPPPSGECGFTAWQPATKSGSPQFNSVGNSREVICGAGDQGLWLNNWAGQVVVGQTFNIRADWNIAYTSGYGNVLALYYDSSGAYFDSEAITLAATNGIENVSVGPFTVPVGTAKIRIDVRLWNGTGSILFDDICLVDTNTAAPPVADITAEVDSVPVTGPVLINTQVDFDGTGSTGTNLTYQWEVWLQDGNLWHSQASGSGSTFSYTYSTIGQFNTVLTVFQDDGQQAYTNFAILVEEYSEITVLYQKHRTGDYRISEHISGYAPLKVTYEAQISSSNVPTHYVWELLDPELNVLETYEVGHILSLILPLGTTTDVSLYGMRLTVQFLSGYTGSYEEHGTVEVIDEVINPVIGPPIPTTITPDTENQINSNWEHTHKFVSSNDGSEGTYVPVVDGSLKTPIITAAVSDFHNPDIADLAVERAIQFKDRGQIFASELIAETAHFIISNVPDFDPQIKNCLWNDNGTPRFSAGIDVGGQPTPDPTYDVEVLINSGDDDAVETSTTVVNLDGTMIRLNSTNLVNAFRFENVTLPTDAVITVATIKAWFSSNGNNLQADVSLELIADSPAFVATAANLSGRTRTVNKDIGSYYFPSEAFYSITLPVAGVQEVVDLPGWASGNAMTVFFDQLAGSNSAIFTYDLGEVYAATLSIQYETDPSSAPPLLVDMVAFWAMDENSPRVDSHTGNYDLTENGTLPRTTGHVYTYAADYDLETVHGLSRDRAFFNPSINDDFSICAWVKLDTLDHSTESPTYYRMLTDTNASGWTGGMQIKSTNGRQIHMYFGIGENDGFDWHTTKYFASSTWEMMVFTHKSNGDGTAELRVSLDAGTPAVTTSDGFTASSTGNFNVGMNNSGINVWDGQIGPFMVFSKVLTDSDIAWIYNNGDGRTYDEFD